MKLERKSRSGLTIKLAIMCAVILLIAVGLAACTNNTETTTTAGGAPTTTQAAVQGNSATTTPDTDEPDTDTTIAGDTTPPAPFDGSKPIKIIAVRQFVVGAWGEQWIAGAQAQAKELGIDFEVVDANSDDSKQVTLLETAITQKPDAIIIGHGKPETLQPGVEKAKAAGIPVVVDNVIMPVDGVPEVSQDDMLMAYQTLSAMTRYLNGKGNVAYVWVGGFAPMEKRQRIWDDILWQYPGLKEVAKYGTASASTMADTLTQTEAVLRQNPEGTLQAIYASWDEFAKGATQAVQQAGRKDVKVFGIDISDIDIQMMTAPDSPWMATSAANAGTSGRVAIRAAATLIAKGTVPKYLFVPPTLVTQEFLVDNKVTNMAELQEVMPEFKDVDLLWTPWMRALAAKNK